MIIVTLRRRLWRLTRTAGWSDTDRDGSLRSRISQALSETGPWYDWGKPVMWLVGRYDSGNAGAPRGRDLWYVHLNDLERFERAWFDGQQNRLGFITTTDSSVVRQHPSAGWRIFDLQDDGHTIVTGYWPTPGSDGRIRPDSIAGNEISLFWRWYWVDHKLKAQWLGIRPWIYYRALHATVHLRKPFACQVAPDPFSGGYRHWYCELRKRHTGDHRYRNYVWSGSGQRVRHDPKVTA